mgnify:CR=1 FL=1
MKTRKPLLLKVTFRSNKNTTFVEPPGVIVDAARRTTHIGGRMAVLEVRPSACGSWESVEEFRKQLENACNIASVRRVRYEHL